MANAPRPKFFIQYDNFITDEVTQEPLVEDLFLEDIRPRPPIVSLPRYIPLDFAVDVFENDSWWSGIVVDKFKSPLS